MNFNNNDQKIYIDKFEESAASIIALEPTAENFRWRGEFRYVRFLYDHSPIKAGEIYLRNHYMDGAIADYLSALRCAKDARELQGIYGTLSIVYAYRAERLLAASDFLKWRSSALRNGDERLKRCGQIQLAGFLPPIKALLCG
jgi:hypothetical protein